LRLFVPETFQGVIAARLGPEAAVHVAAVTVQLGDGRLRDLDIQIQNNRELRTLENEEYDNSSA